jgi:Tfp pilus assembly protein PilX
MKATNQLQRSEQGSVLVGVMCFLFLATGLVTTILVLGSNHRKISQRQVNMEQAMDVAEAGMERGARFMESNVVAITGSSTGNTNGTGAVGSGTYNFVITRTNTTTYNLTSTGTVNNVSRTVSLRRVYQPTYAEFALWSSNNASLYFKDGEVFNGHVHSNGQLYFDNSGGGPIFHSYVTSLASSYVGDITGIEFDKGLTLNSYQGSMADVDFNSAASTSLKNIATSNNGLVLDGNTTITLNGGTLSIINTRKGWSTAHTYTLPATENIIYIKDSNTGSVSTQAGTAYLTGGSVNGRLTIVTESDMYVQGNITYASNPVTNPNSDDALGLISRSDVWVDTSAPNNVVIDAAIMATGLASGTDGSFGVINYNSGSPRGTLNVYGGIVQLIRGAVGQFNTSSGTTTHGFEKNYSYDPRFIVNPPPYYPTIANKVEFSQWREGN